VAHARRGGLHHPSHLGIGIPALQRRIGDPFEVVRFQRVHEEKAGLQCIYMSQQRRNDTNREIHSGRNLLEGEGWFDLTHYLKKDRKIHARTHSTKLSSPRG
jgi:hypothetical protein